MWKYFVVDFSKYPEMIQLSSFLFKVFRWFVVYIETYSYRCLRYQWICVIFYYKIIKWSLFPSNEIFFSIFFIKILYRLKFSVHNFTFLMWKYLVVDFSEYSEMIQLSSFLFKVFRWFVLYIETYSYRYL